VFAPVEAAFDLIAQAAGVAGAVALPVRDLVVGFGDDGGDVFGPHQELPTTT
jgi:hypothetical protein